MPIRKPITFILIPITVGLSSSWVLADTAVTPLKTYAQSPVQSNSLATELRSAFAMKDDSVELFATGTISSVWAHSESFQYGLLSKSNSHWSTMANHP